MTKFEYDMYKEYEKFDKKTTNAAKGGLNFLEVLLVVFIVLKLCKVITWSWWWVLSPIWIPLILWFIFIAIVGIIKLFYKLKRK